MVQKYNLSFNVPILFALKKVKIDLFLQTCTAHQNNAYIYIF